MLDSTMAAEVELHPGVPPGLHLLSAFLAMEPSDSLVSLVRECCGAGPGVTESVQRFIWEHCLSIKAHEVGYAHYSKNFLKKLILEIESADGVVLDELYEQCTYYMSSVKDGGFSKGNVRVCKYISFLFPDDCFVIPSCPRSGKLVVPLYCSLNMLEGDTGCSIWPSSLYLSEFVLSFPEIFSDNKCFEIGAGVGLVGVCLSHVKASKIATSYLGKQCEYKVYFRDIPFNEVVLSDGDLSTLANMQLNLELNQLSPVTDSPDSSAEDQTMEKPETDNKSKVQCIHLPWECAKESELQKFMPDIILGADIIYDPSCLTHLVQVLSILLCPSEQHSQRQKKIGLGSLLDDKRTDVETCDSTERKVYACDLESENGFGYDHHRAEEHRRGYSDSGSKQAPVAYIASVIRNIETFNYFLELAEQANLKVTDITETPRPLNLLSYMRSCNRSSVRLFTVTSK